MDHGWHCKRLRRCGLLLSGEFCYEWVAALWVGRIHAPTALKDEEIMWALLMESQSKASRRVSINIALDLQRNSLTKRPRQCVSRADFSG